MKSLLAVAIALVSAPAFANDVTSTHCEIFVDRIQVTTSSHAHTTAHFFVKVVAARLDAPVKAVGVVHSRDESRSDRPGESHGFQYDALPSFLGSADYFQFSAVTGHDWMTARELASFVVETTNGTRYWLNQRNAMGENFAIDGGMIHALTRRHDGSYRPDGVRAHGWDLATIQQTADYPQDLASLYNPNRCR